MPSLDDALAELAHQSAEITYQASLNVKPAGPFTAAYLYLPEPGSSSSAAQLNVLSLIRDADDSEKRPFQFIGEVEEGGSTSSVTGGGGLASKGTRRVELREGHIVTPLKELRHKQGSKEEIDLTLNAAIQVVDNYRSMPRAKAHVRALVDTHQRQAARIAELERLIIEASNTARATPKPQSESIPVPPSPRPEISPDQAIKAEEEALRALELSLGPLRRAAASRTASTSAMTSSPRSPLLPRAVPSGMRSPASNQSTPRAQPRTPARAMPVVTNSLVQATPHRSVVQPVPPLSSRFSPLRLLGTPRAPRPSVLQSTLRTTTIADDADEDSAQQTIFTRPFTRPTMTPVRWSGETVPEKRVEDEEADDTGADDTVRLDSLQRSLPEPSSLTTPTRAEPVSALSTTSSTASRNVEGVDVDLPHVQPCVERIWDTLGDLMRMGIGPSETVPRTSYHTINHLHRISRSDPPSPASPSTASTISSAIETSRALPITAESILLAHLCLMLLRSASDSGTASEASDAFVFLPDLKERLGAVGRARRWEAAEDLASKTVYAAVGKKTVKIDRRGGGGGRVRFALS